MYCHRCANLKSQQGNALRAFFFKFAEFNTKQRESRKHVELNDLQQVCGLFVCLLCVGVSNTNSFIQEFVLKECR